jgi:hypothetical protein
VSKSWSVLLVGLILLAAGTAQATPPDSISISVDSASVLSVAVHHPVRKAEAGHFLKGITQMFSSQTDLNWQRVAYTVIDLKKDDKVTVNAACSWYGTLARTITVASP